MKIFFSAGEPSGDVHGANLIRALRRQGATVEAAGFGGPRMAEAGCELIEDLTQFAVMWFARVLVRLPHFLALLARADRHLRDKRPDLVVLIDYPGFNWWIARRARAHGIPVVYYGAPQIWAWARWRVSKLRRLVDHVLCKLPFEPAWYAERGCKATYVGHPFFDEVRRYELDEEFLAARSNERPLVAVLPGSRTQEVALNLPGLLRAIAHVHRQVAGARFAVAAYRPSHAITIREAIAEGRRDGGLPQDLAIDVCVGRTPELIHLSTCCMAVSGSVSLELLYHTRPTVILYTISRLADLAQSFGRTVKYITLVNLLEVDNLDRTDRSTYDPREEGAEPVPFPEYLTSRDRSEDMASHVVEWLNDPRALAAKRAELARLKERFAQGGASERAARYLLETVAPRREPPPRPHFLPAEAARTGGKALKR